MREKELRSFDGTRLVYQVGGEEGRWLVVANGYGGTFCAWSELFARLTRPFRLLNAYCAGGICTLRKRPGEACDPGFLSDLECLGPAYCQGGTCQSMNLVCAPAASGSTCTLFLFCEESSYCDLLGGLVCRPRKADGEACMDMVIINPCQRGSHCVASVCQPYARLGEPCAARACDPGEACCDESKSCKALKYRGESCSSDQECLSDHCQSSGSGGKTCDGPCKQP